MEGNGSLAVALQRLDKAEADTRSLREIMLDIARDVKHLREVAKSHGVALDYLTKAVGVGETVDGDD